MAPGSSSDTGPSSGHDASGLKRPLLSEDDQINNQLAHDSAERGQACDEQLQDPQQCCKATRRCSTLQTTAALLTLQLGWGLWLLPCDFARLGWIPGFATLITLALCTTYSGSLFTRLYGAVPNAVLFGDVGEAAAGRKGRMLVYGTIYSLDATRCIILHLAATQSLSHAIAPLLGHPLPLWQCSAVVAVVVLLLGQIRYLTQLSSFFMAGTSAQMVALAIVIYDLVMNAGPPPAGPSGAPGAALLAAPAPELYRSVMIPESLLQGAWTPAAMAVLNMIFAYGGQFAFLELMSSMKQPNRFSRAVMMCTAIMTVLYGGFGAVGYWSKGASIKGIVIFNMTPGPAAQIAAGFIFFQALAQYLVNLNCWTHNLLVLVARRKGNAAEGEEGTVVEGEHMSTGDHNSGHWLMTTAFVASYSAVVAVAVPFFCTLVGLVTSVTYLTCAYTLPAWFALKLLGSRLGRLEKGWLIAIIPISIILSVIGLVASVFSYINEASGGEGM